MKKIFLCLLLSLFAINKGQACADYGYDSDFYYYNLFIQEIIDDPEYYPFLMTYSSPFYSSKGADGIPKSENIEQWQAYFGISYDDAAFLVFKATLSDVEMLVAGKPATNARLKFADARFAKKYKDALHYLAYAKYMEPYMSVSGYKWVFGSYDDNKMGAASDLDYDEVNSTLIKGWNSTKNKELKLRYGYQLVRFAHYTGRYQAAIDYFDQYVESLNIRPAMYYHALSQKAGANRGLGHKDDANYNFFQVFCHSRNLKESALLSIRFTEDVDFNHFLERAKTASERNDAYMLLGFYSFSDPLSSMQKIVTDSPDAIQTKVLMARAINSIERNSFQQYYYCPKEGLKNVSDRRYPVYTDIHAIKYLKNLMDFSDTMAVRPEVKERNFWYLTSAYLAFLNKDFTKAQACLSEVDATNQKYASQKANLSMLVDICATSLLNSESENRLYAKYKSVFNQNADIDSYWNENFDRASYDTHNFVVDVLANRYFLQGDYAKSFLMNNRITALENNPDLKLLNAIDAFYNKQNKNLMEQFIVKRIYPPKNVGEKGAVIFDPEKFDVPSYIAEMRGNIYLAQGNLDNALLAFRNVKEEYVSYYNSWGGLVPMIAGGFYGVSSAVFGHNRIECFECSREQVMQGDYINDFAYIKETMNKAELVEVLIKLRKDGELSGDKAAKANYLLGNFFYNVTPLGYFRQLLCYDLTNGNGPKFHSSSDDKPNWDNLIYFKNYSTFYSYNYTSPKEYLEKSYLQAADTELKAHIAFALSKSEQADFYTSNNIDSYSWWSRNEYPVLIKDRRYFKELQKYSKTAFYSDVKTNCLYFAYYVNNYVR